MKTDETEAVRARYAKRNRLGLDKLYDPLIPYNYMVTMERHLALVRCIQWAGLAPVSEKRVLEIGCGAGNNLLQFLLLGFRPENLVANELLEARAQEARRRLPEAITLLVGNACDINGRDATFDVVLQSTVFTSILDNSFQEELANRLWELVKPSGGILWYDYIYDNPKNPDVRGVPLRRIRQLFPRGEIKFWRVTLAPPIGRLVTRISTELYGVFNALPLLRTHVLCWIRKP